MHQKTFLQEILIDGEIMCTMQTLAQTLFFSTKSAPNGTERLANTLCVAGGDFAAAPTSTEQ